MACHLQNDTCTCALDRKTGLSRLSSLSRQDLDRSGALRSVLASGGATAHREGYVRSIALV